MGDGEKLLTYLYSALKALLGFDIFPCLPKKKSEILLPSVIVKRILKYKMAEWHEQHSCGSEQIPEEVCCGHGDELPVSIKRRELFDLFRM